MQTTIEFESSVQNGVITVPAEYLSAIHGKVTVCFPSRPLRRRLPRAAAWQAEPDESEAGTQPAASSFGLLSAVADPSLARLEKGAWARAAAEKERRRLGNG